VSSHAYCATAADAYYYDNAASPTELILCEDICDIVKASADASANVELGCARRPAATK
jgi:hypothetical protein